MFLRHVPFTRSNLPARKYYLGINFGLPAVSVTGKYFSKHIFSPVTCRRRPPGTQDSLDNSSWSFLLAWVFFVDFCFCFHFCLAESRRVRSCGVGGAAEYPIFGYAASSCHGNMARVVWRSADVKQISSVAQEVLTGRILLCNWWDRGVSTTFFEIRRHALPLSWRHDKGRLNPRDVKPWCGCR